MRGSYQRNPGDAIFRSGAPATITIIVIAAITFFLGTVAQAQSGLLLLAFIGSRWIMHPWTLVTWPLLNVDHPFNVLLECAWAYWMCGSLERSWGTRTFVAFFAAVSALTALTVWLGGQYLLGTPTGMAGLYVALAAPTIAWCAINRRESVSFWGIGIPAPILALITMVFAWYEVGPPILGLFALSGCAAAYWYAIYGRYTFRGYATNRPAGRSGRTPNLRMQDYEREPVASSLGRLPFLNRIKAWQERRRLERLWKNSFGSDSREGDDRKR